MEILRLRPLPIAHVAIAAHVVQHPADDPIFSIRLASTVQRSRAVSCVVSDREDGILQSRFRVLVVREWLLFVGVLRQEGGAVVFQLGVVDLNGFALWFVSSLARWEEYDARGRTFIELYSSCERGSWTLRPRAIANSCLEALFSTGIVETICEEVKEGRRGVGKQATKWRTAMSQDNRYNQKTLG